MQVRQLIIALLLLYSFQSIYAQGKDTINITDDSGLKQGYWIVFGESKPKSCYQPNKKVAEGYYKDNKKTGLWIEYFCDNEIKNKIEFKEGRPNGKAIMFHQNGEICESGTFAINKWVGEYTLYYETAKPQQLFTFNENGKREGIQKYYYRNGIVQAMSTWKENKEYAYLQFDTLGELKVTALNGIAIKEGDKISDADKKIIDTMMAIATKENGAVPPTKKLLKKKEATKPNIQDVNFNRKEIQKSN